MNAPTPLLEVATPAGNEDALKLQGALTIYEAARTKGILVRALEGSAPLAVDLSQVGEIDTSGVQLLLMAQGEAARSGRPFEVVAASDAVRDVLALYRLLHQLAPALQSNAPIAAATETA